MTHQQPCDTPVAFLKRQLDIESKLASSIREKKEVAFKQTILFCHEKWPILVESLPEIDIKSDNIDSFVVEASKRLHIMTQNEYVKKFGDVPPTAPIIDAMLELYSDYPGFNPEWRT